VAEHATVALDDRRLVVELQSLGVRAISNVVDATNLALLESGQPVHAFDLDQLADETIETLLAQHAAGRAPVRELHLHQGGGAMARTPAGGTAFAHRDAAYLLNIIARSPDRQGFEEHVGWARATHQAMDPWSTGGYVNFTSEPGQDKVRASYPPDTYARLVAVKDRYDPANLFQLNQNIPPSGGR